MANETVPVVKHYTRNNLMERIRTALVEADYDPDQPTVEMLSELDHLHGGGYATTRTQARLANIPHGCHVLDAGCGIGGPSRYLAGRLGCTVEAIDLTPEYVEIARQLNESVGLGDRISVQIGNVTELPFEDESFDVVLCQNVTMNVADKPAMFAEALRVLKPGGLYTISHLAEGPNGPPIYPLPWARTPETSFLETPLKILDLLSQAGFSAVEDVAQQSSTKPGEGSPPRTIGAAPAMGDDIVVRTGNSSQSVRDGRLIPMIILARRPS
ncbi:MAG: class I SAM-dependent methyltransferase [Salaquimonas sp.]|nr:class I SAM-dependent methyltransferase [Salaquimonas sp.]